MSQHNRRTYPHGSERAARTAAKQLRLVDRTIVGVRNVGAGKWVVDTWQRAVR